MLRPGSGWRNAPVQEIVRFPIPVEPGGRRKKHATSRIGRSAPRSLHIVPVWANDRPCSAQRSGFGEGRHAMACIVPAWENGRPVPCAPSSLGRAWPAGDEKPAHFCATSRLGRDRRFPGGAIVDKTPGNGCPYRSRLSQGGILLHRISPKPGRCVENSPICFSKCRYSPKPGRCARRGTPVVCRVGAVPPEPGRCVLRLTSNVLMRDLKMKERSCCRCMQGRFHSRFASQIWNENAFDLYAVARYIDCRRTNVISKLTQTKVVTQL